MKSLLWLWSESDADVSMEEGSEIFNVAGFEVGGRVSKPKDTVASRSWKRERNRFSPKAATKEHSPQKPMSDFSPTELYSKMID